VAVLCFVAGCTQVNQSSSAGAVGLANEKPGIVQSATVNRSTKTVTVNILKNDVEPSGHHTPTMNYRAQRIQLPVGWRVRVVAQNTQHQALGASIVPGSDASLTQTASGRLGTNVRFTQPGNYVVLSSRSGQHGYVLDYIRVSRSVTAPKISVDERG
jgi:hypothetical protein